MPAICPQHEGVPFPTPHLACSPLPCLARILHGVGGIRPTCPDMQMPSLASPLTMAARPSYERLPLGTFWLPHKALFPKQALRQFRSSSQPSSHTSLNPIGVLPAPAAPFLARKIHMGLVSWFAIQRLDLLSQSCSRTGHQSGLRGQPCSKEAKQELTRA